MTSRRVVLMTLVALTGISALGYWLYPARAVQGRGALAQAPMNIENRASPAFVMAVDDSGSMTFETLFPGRDGYACYSNGSFFESGRLRTSGTCNYHHLIPHSGSRYRIDTGRYAIPPLDEFGFARSPDFNPQYYDPGVTYSPWLRSDESHYPNSSPTAAPVDPRDTSPTINLLAQREVAGDNVLHFRVLRGMVIPADTRYYKTDNCDGLGGPSNRWTSRNSPQTVNETCQIGISYYPAVFYLRTDRDPPPGFRADRRIRIVDACGSGCDLYKYEIKQGNYSSTAAFDAAARNFANWFTYYGNRNRAMIAGMTHSLIDINNMRIGYFRINQHGSFDEPLTRTAERVRMRDMTDDAQRALLYNDIIALPASGSTPNRQAVNAAGLQFTRTDDDAPVALACQKNAVMLFTDGYSNSDGPTIGNVDGAMPAPFRDGHSNTMADIVTRFYLNTNGTIGAGGVSPLRTGSGFPAGGVPVPPGCSDANPDPRLDCQSNLHINFYGITLGARGQLYDPEKDQNPYSDASIYSNWPSRQNDNPTTVDDIWHATINTRGEYVNARTPRDITDAMRRILAAVGEGATPSGSIALTGARVGDGSLTVEPSYRSTNSGTDWHGELTAYKVASTPAGKVSSTRAWAASERLPRIRNILYGSGREFTAANVGSFAALCSNSLATCSESLVSERLPDLTLDDAIAYLAGDQRLEVKNGHFLRDRTSVLGDIVNSTPVVSMPKTDDYGYRSQRNGIEFDPHGYKSYLANKKNRDPMVYIGANDGMLHAFNGNTGVEEFAYIPSTAVGHMGNLLFPYNGADKNAQIFQHRYYVDGPITVSDAFFGGSSWKTVLVGTAGAGGRGVFALDVSNPGSFGSGHVLWEINDQNGNATIADNIGYVLGKPVIVPVKIGTSVRWKAVFGNGYNSNNGVATLFVVDIANGSVATVQASEGSGAPAGSNGLGNVVVLDRWVGSTATSGRDGYADTVYAGDQNGVVWKFDLRQTTPPSPARVFVATDASGNRQPITGGFDAAAGPGGGVMLYFGTGSFSFTNDPTDFSVQTLYGVLDRGTGTTVTRADLHEQTILEDNDGFRAISRTPMAPGKLGWRIDLNAGTATGERFVGYPRVESGIVFFPTYDPATAGGCEPSGVNRLYGLSALTGGAALAHVRVEGGAQYGSGTGAVMLQTSGSAPVKNVAVMSTSRLSPLAAGATEEEIEAALEARCSMVVQVSGAPLMTLPRPCGRQSWRQIR